MKTSSKGIALIREFEGVRLACYHLGDGVCTIGYGHTRPLNQCGGAGSWRITQEQAEVKLKTDLVKYENIVNNRFRNLNQNQFDALVSFSYNTGDPFIKDGWSESARHKPDGNYITASMMNYVNPPQFREGLTRRRNAEVALFRSPATASTPQPAPQPTPSQPSPWSPINKSLEQMATDVLLWKVGQGEERKQRLGKYFTAVQAIVNERLKQNTAQQTHNILASETKAGRFGDGETRKRYLGTYFNAVQNIINQSVSPASSQIIYTVKAGDNLSAIAKKHNVTLERILNLNPSIKNANLIQVGQKIIISK
jgi:GH24 family phage-related lysozyme (muramidase)/LysM repeat protein